MAKKKEEQTISALSARVKELEGILHAAGIKLGPENLMDEIEQAESTARDKLDRLFKEYLENRNAIVVGCEEETGRPLVYNQPTTATEVRMRNEAAKSQWLDVGTRIHEHMVEIMAHMAQVEPIQATDFEPGCNMKETLRRIGFYANPKREKYTFGSKREFIDYAIDQLSDGWKQNGLIE